MMNFSIRSHNAWAPGIVGNAQWRAWAARPFVPRAGNAAPDLDFLPALQRRRLGPLARMAVACAWPLAAAAAPMPVVYASQHGETSRGSALLQTLVRDEPLSPTSFSLSVHNAIAGMWSILRKETTESVAVSGLGDSLECGLTEASLLLQAGHESVMVIVAEESPPACYETWVRDVPFSYAVALHVTAGAGFHVRKIPHGSPRKAQAAPEPSASDAPPAPAAPWPHALELVRHLMLGAPAWEHGAGSQGRWRWERQC